MKLSISDRVAVPTMVSTIGCGEVVSNRPTRALAMAEIDIWIKPSSEEAVPAMWGKGLRAIAIELGSTRPSEAEKKCHWNHVRDNFIRVEE